MKEVKNNKKRFFIIGIVVLLIVILGLVSYFTFFNNKRGRVLGGGGTRLANPIEGLSDEQAIAQFNEGFVLYLIYSIGASKLHNPPLSSDTPKIVFFIDKDIFNAEVVKGNIIVKRGNINDADIMIITSREEGVKMLRDRNYVVKSFSDGKSSFSALANKISLLSKGYLDMYNKLTA